MKRPNLFKVNNKDTKIMYNVALVFLLWVWNIFHTLFWCFHCWRLWTSKYQLGYNFCIVCTCPLFRISFFFTKRKMSQKYKNQLFENSVGAIDTVKLMRFLSIYLSLILFNLVLYNCLFHLLLLHLVIYSCFFSLLCYSSVQQL